jgi:ABC-type nitrate/sulfonate/bicarbonate transport system substrate-binding protein
MRRQVSRRLSMVHAMLLLTLGAALSLSACGPRRNTSPQTVRLGFSSAIDYLPYFVMRERGIDRKEGLRFETTPLAGGAALIAAMAADTIDVGYVGAVPVRRHRKLTP